mmetsp:Transcript_51223/g.76009  ORF Transcript_51223/g.76009 Transcript_51223/m.76009 type:complete len:292 (+) Transcript_51223:44-919(+)
MVEVEELQDEAPNNTTPQTPSAKEHVEESPSASRIRDADEIEEISKSIKRPSARAHLDALVAKLRREGTVLKRVEASKAKAGDTSETESSAPPAAASVPTPAPAPVPTRTAAAPIQTELKYVSIDKFSFDMGSHSSQFITLYVALPGVGSIPRSQVKCTFVPTSFDFIVEGLKGKSYRLLKDNLENEIDAEKCKYIVKSDKVLIKLAKKKGEYGYESWPQLLAKKGKKTADKKKEDPSSSIMEMMKDMYDEGDDNMKKMIGETMMKQRNGELGKDMDMPGMGGLGGGMPGL